MNDFKIITIENDASFVTIDTLVQFSGNGEKPIKALIRKYIDKIEAKGCAFSKSSDSFKFKRLASGTNENSLDWSILKLNERQAMFLLTLMANSEQVVDFKDNLETEFYKFKNQSTTKVMTNEELLALATVRLAESEQKRIKATKMMESAKLIEFTNNSDDDTISMSEFAKVLSDKFGVMIGRNTIYIILSTYLSYVMLYYQYINLKGFLWLEKLQKVRR